MSDLPSVEEYAAAYHGIRGRVRAMIEKTNSSQLEAICPATPAWRVRDTLAHVSGVPADILAGRMENVASNEWTQAQVDARANSDVDGMLAAWDSEASQLDPIMGAFPIVSLGQMVFDAYTHELDIAHALGVVTDKAVPAASYAFAWVIANGGAGTQQPLVLITEIGPVDFGAVQASSASVEISRFDFFRAATGRRSAQQIAQYPASGPVDPQLMLLAPIFALSAVDIVE